MIAVDEVRHVAVIGGGTIGASWAAFFLSRGLAVSVYDIEAGRRRYVEDYIQNAWPAPDSMLGSARRPPAQWTFHDRLPDAIAGAQFVQESVSETVEIKRAVFRELDDCLRPEVVIASSTSSLCLTDLQAGMRSAHRFVVAHPFNPPHLMPLIEIVAGKQTDLMTRDWCRHFYERLGKSVLVLRKEVIGHVANRLQAALFQEAICLIREGIVDVADVDRAMAFGPALRWVLMGPFLTFHLGAQDRGIRGYLGNLGAAHLEMFKALGQVRDLSPDIVEAIAMGVDRETGGAPILKLLQHRDLALTSLLAYMQSEAGRLLR